MISRRALLLAAGGAIGASAVGRSARAQTGPVAIVGGTLWRGDAEPRKDAVVVIDGAKISAVGGGAAGATVIDASDKIITAGLIALDTTLGVDEVSLEASTRDDAHGGAKDHVRAAFRIADGYNPASTLIPITRQHGITSASVVPSGGLVCGQSAWVDLDGRAPADAIARASLALRIDPHDGMFGSNSRGTAMLRLRELFDDARAYRTDKRGYERRQLRQLGASRLDLEVVVKALDGALPVVVSAERASDILHWLALAKEHNLRLVLDVAGEAWKVAPQIAAANVPVIVHPLRAGPETFAALGSREDNAALLHAAGVTIALAYGEAHNARKLRQAVGNAIRAGLPARAALGACTETPARIFGMDGYGAPASGRVANLVVWSGDPFELSSRAERVFIRGREVSLRTRQTALLERYR